MDEVSCIVPHQANDRIIRFAAKKLGVPYERWQVSIAEAGNTGPSERAHGAFRCRTTKAASRRATR